MIEHLIGVTGQIQTLLCCTVFCLLELENSSSWLRGRNVVDCDHFGAARRPDEKVRKHASKQGTIKSHYQV